MRAQRRAERDGGAGPRIGGLVVATILIVVGLGAFFPELPWQLFWGVLWILVGAWIVFLWGFRGRGYRTQSAPANA